MKSTIILCILVITHIFSYGQGIVLKENNQYSDAQIINENGEIIQVKNLELNADQVSYSVKNDGINQAKTVNINSLQKVMLPIGKKKNKGLLYGGVIGGAIGAGILVGKEINIAAEEEKYGYTVTGGQVRYLMPVVGVALGVGIGALVGKSKNIYTVAYENKKTAYLNYIKIDATALNSKFASVAGIKCTLSF